MHSAASQRAVLAPLGRQQRPALARPLVALRPSAQGLFRDLRPLRTAGSFEKKPSWRLARQAARGGDLAMGRGDDSLIDTDYVPKGELLSTKLPADVRRRAEEAISKRGYRVTVGDVAAAGGLTLQQAEAALKALAADSLATLEVSSEGEILYAFKPGFREGLQARSLLLRLEPAAAAVWQGLAYLGRVAFGTALITSVVSVYLAIMVIASSGGRDDNRERRSSGGGYYYSGGGPRIWFDLTDVLWYWDPFYYRHRRERAAAGKGMGFLEAIFSFVFGDGDPNAEYDRKRWQAIGRYIQGRGGVVAAEEIAPFLDVEPGQVASDRGRVAVDESYMLPVLARLGGEPEVDAAGNLLYSFPSLQATGGAALRMSAQPPVRAALEQPWKLTEASAGQQLGVVALGIANLVGVVALSGMLQSPANAYALAANGLAWIMGALPLLQAYAASFFAIPVWRWFRNRARNAGIEKRNEARLEATALVQSPDSTLATKLRSAAQQAQRRVLTERDAVYRSDREVAAQPRDLEGELFEERLERRERERAEAAAAAAARQWQPGGQQGQGRPRRNGGLF